MDVLDVQQGQRRTTIIVRNGKKGGDATKEQQLVDCATQQSHGCNGGVIDDAFGYLATYAAMTEAAYPYAGR